MELADTAAAAALGAVQGLTEFLPVSSSGHVALGALVFGIPDLPLTTVVVLHGGTLIATLAVVGNDVWRLAEQTRRGVTHPKDFLRSDAGRIVTGVVLASLPTALIGLMLDPYVERWSHTPAVIGGCFLVSAAMLMATRSGGGKLHLLGPWGYVAIGLAQGLAVMPGLSRSGMTIATAMLLGLSGLEAFRFSFLLSIPAVGGALLLKLLEPGAGAALGPSTWIGGTVALGTGYVALRALRRVVKQGRFWAFALYLAPLGAGLLAWAAWRSSS